MVNTVVQWRHNDENTTIVQHNVNLLKILVESLGGAPKKIICLK